MTIQVVDGGRASMDAILFGGIVKRNDMDYVRDIVGDKRLVGVSDYFTNSIQTLNNVYNSDESVMFNKSIVLRHSAIKNEDAYIILTLENLPAINLRMKEVVMSHPEMMRLNNLGAVQGYSEVVARDNLYKYVNANRVTYEEDMMVYHTYVTSEDDVPDEMDIYSIRESWSLISEMLQDGLDPTEM